MGNNPDAFLQCSPTYLLSYALNRVHDHEQLKTLLQSKVLLIHGEQVRCIQNIILIFKKFFLIFCFLKKKFSKLYDLPSRIHLIRQQQLVISIIYLIRQEFHQYNSTYIIMLNILVQKLIL